MNWKNLNFYKEKRRGCHDSRWVWIECEFILSRTCHDLTHHCPLRIHIIDIELYLDLLTPRQGWTNTNMIFLKYRTRTLLYFHPWKIFGMRKFPQKSSHDALTLIGKSWKTQPEIFLKFSFFTGRFTGKLIH